MSQERKFLWISLIIAPVVIALSIFLHELGHFWILGLIGGEGEIYWNCWQHGKAPSSVVIHFVPRKLLWLVGLGPLTVVISMIPLGIFFLL